MPTRFRQKLQSLTYMDFEGHDRHETLTLELSDEELLEELGNAPKSDRFLGRYGHDEIEALFVRYGILDKLDKLGFKDPKIEIRTDEVHTHRLYVYFDELDYEHTLIELRLREGWFRPNRQFVPELQIGPSRMILVDWLMLQNPTRSFDTDRPALPEQRHPGLGVLQDLIPMVMEVVKESGRKGVLDVPEHYHGALFYSRWFRFFNPEIEGKFLAMQRDLSSHPLHLVTHGIDKGCLHNTKTGAQEDWRPGEQILPLCDEFDEYFANRAYIEKRDAAFLGNEYELDLEACKENDHEKS